MNTFSDGANGVPFLLVSNSDPLPGYSVTFFCFDTNVEANPQAQQVNWTKDGVVIKEPFQNIAQVKDLSLTTEGTT